MSLKTFIVQIEDAALEALKSAGTVLEAFVITESQKLVAEAKASNLGTLALNLIEVFASHDATGAQKMASVVGALVPAIETFVAGGGLKGLAVSAEDFALEFAQSAYNDFKANVLSKVG